MTAGPDRLRGGYCEYPGVTPAAGNPDWWAREITPPAVRAAEPPADPGPAVSPVESITPAVDPTEPPREPAEIELLRHWTSQPWPPREAYTAIRPVFLPAELDDQAALRAASAALLADAWAEAMATIREPVPKRRPWWRRLIRR